MIVVLAENVLGHRLERTNQVVKDVFITSQGCRYYPSTKLRVELLGELICPFFCAAIAIDCDFGESKEKNT